MVRTSLMTVVFAAAGCLGSLGLSEAQSPIPTERAHRFCVVPVKDGAPTEADVGQAWRITGTKFRIPGLPSLVFAPNNRRGQWTIDSNRRLVPYVGAFPQSYLDQEKWMVEPWSGRVVAVTFGRGLSVLNPGTHTFSPIDVAFDSESFSRVFILPRRHLSIAVTSKGNSFVVEQQTVRPWLTPQEMATNGLRGIRSLHDVPSMAATIVLDQEGRIHILTDEGQWHRIGSIGKDDYGRVFEASNSAVALFLAQKAVVAIRKDTRGHFSAETLVTTSANGAARQIHLSPMFGQALMHQAAGVFHKDRWVRVGPSGFEEIADTVGIPNSRVYPHGRLTDLPTIGKALVDGEQGLFLYDGVSFAPVEGGRWDRVDTLYRVHDLQSIGRVLITSKLGVFELSRDGQLERRTLPFATEGLPRPNFVDWPEAGVALASTGSGLFVLDRELTAAPVPGGDRIGLGWLDFSNGTNPATGDMVLTGKSGLFLAVDSQRDTLEACRAQRSVEANILESRLCLRPIQGTESSVVGHAIGQIVEAPLGQGLIFDSVKGLFFSDVAGLVTQLEARDGSYTRTLVQLPWSDEILAAGSRDSVVRTDLSVQRLATRQYSQLLHVFPSIQAAVLFKDHTGGPLQITRRGKDGYELIDTNLRQGQAGFLADAPWLGGPLVENWEGFFVMDKGGNLTKFDIEGLPPDYFLRLRGGRSPYTGGISAFSVPRLQTIFLWRKRWAKISADRRWSTLTGLPDEALVLAVFDPGSGDVLLGTSMGIFVLNARGEARRMSETPRRTVRVFARLAASPNILAGGDEGIFQINSDALTVAPLSPDVNEAIGSVQRIVDASFAGFNLIEASNGTYILRDGSIEIVRELAPAAGTSNVTALPRLQKLLLKRNGGEEPMLLELGLSGTDGSCETLQRK